MNLHLAYPTVTKDHKLTGVTLVAKLTKAHRHLTYSRTKNNAHMLPPVAFYEPNQLVLVTQPTIS
jgi:hypothetical protein